MTEETNDRLPPITKAMIPQSPEQQLLASVLRIEKMIAGVVNGTPAESKEPTPPTKPTKRR